MLSVKQQANSIPLKKVSLHGSDNGWLIGIRLRRLREIERIEQIVSIGIARAQRLQVPA